MPVRLVEGAGVQHLPKPFFGVKPFITTDTGCWLYLDFDELLEKDESMRKLKWCVLKQEKFAQLLFCILSLLCRWFRFAQLAKGKKFRP